MKKTNLPPVRIAYLLSHPIQYQAPLLREIAKVPEFDLTVFFRSDFSTKNFKDPGFGTQIGWDTDLLTGYHFEFLPAFGTTDRLTFWQPFNYGLWERLRKGRIQILWVHGYATAFNLYVIIVTKLLGIKVLVRDEATLVSKHRSKLKDAIKKIFFSCLDMLVDGFLAIGTMNKQYYLANGISEKKIFDMPYAVDNVFFQKEAEHCRNKRDELRASLGLAMGRLVILFASKLIRRKRALDLLEAFNTVLNTIQPRPYLLFIGDGEMRHELENRIKQLSLEADVFMLGFKNQSELPCYYDLCDVFVLPSFHEPWGLVINEAMNAGRAVIASDQVGSAYDLIIRVKNGFMFQAGNIQDLASALTEVLSAPEQYERMGKASLELISEWSFDQDIGGLKSAVKAILTGKETIPDI
ncbi:MAG: glycosyltransferase family 4 protein [Syntrophaceae bacterium]|nr:glycosyltransferase family 4 protein [Syntrophaceae bacterium]